MSRLETRPSHPPPPLTIKPTLDDASRAGNLHSAAHHHRNITPSLPPRLLSWLTPISRTCVFCVLEPVTSHAMRAWRDRYISEHMKPSLALQHNTVTASAMSCRVFRETSMRLALAVEGSRAGAGLPRGGPFAVCPRWPPRKTAAVRVALY